MLHVVAGFNLARTELPMPQGCLPYPNFPKPVCDASRHRGRHLKRLMDTNEIVIEEVERYRMGVVFHYFIGHLSVAWPRGQSPEAGL
jgi:hypothetical protein